MQDLNVMIIVGRVATEPQFKSDKYSRLDFSFVWNTTKKIGDKYEDKGNFSYITLWGKQAETMSNLLVKGRQICIKGSLEVNQWEKDGVKHSDLRIIPDQIQLIGPAKKDDQSENVGW